MSVFFFKKSCLSLMTTNSIKWNKQCSKLTEGNFRPTDYNSTNGRKPHIKTLSQTTNFRLSQFQRVCRRHFKMWWNLKMIFRYGRKHCGKRRNCSLWAISSFPTIFSRVVCNKMVKYCYCLVMGVQAVLGMRLISMR